MPRPVVDGPESCARRARIATWKTAKQIGTGVFGLVALLGAFAPAGAQSKPAPYPTMAPLAQYQLARQSDEIALARSAAPASVSDSAEILSLGSHGYDTVIRGRNGFVCLVERSWGTTFEDPGFWNPKIRSPMCLNAAAARSVLPPYLERTRWVLTGLSNTEMRARTESEAAKKSIPVPQTGAMCYMLSKQSYLADNVGHARPHLMFFFPHTDGAAWGADLPGSPITTSQNDPSPAVTTFFVPAVRWSDGTLSTTN